MPKIQVNKIGMHPTGSHNKGIVIVNGKQIRANMNVENREVIKTILIQIGKRFSKKNINSMSNIELRSNLTMFVKQMQIAI